MEYLFCTDSLSKYYGTFHALDGLSMHVPEGSIYGFVGENGAGKTTLIRLLCGLQYPSEGGFTLLGKDSKDTDIASVRRKMGAVVETPAIYYDMTAAENLRQQYCILGTHQSESVEEMLKLVGLDHVGHKKVKNFSLGMRQRLGIAMALAGNPDFLILDEPTNGLDPQGIIEIRKLIIKLNQEHHITILISSHILNELSKLATHYGFIAHGKMIQEITASELEEACGKRVYMEVSDAKVLAQVLTQMQVQYTILSKTSVCIHKQMNITQLALKLYEEKCEIFTCSEQDESLEEYYLKLIEDGQNTGGEDDE
ncbi:MAG: ATP-binding cassette domain-containing protein [bacterium]|nr:ATP-binding cassette domain-containing protein [bacterium]